MRISRKIINSLASSWMLLCFVFFLILPLAICLGLVIKSLPIIQESSFLHLMFSSDWQPNNGEFGFLPFILSSVWVTIISLVFTIPVCLFSSIYITQYAPSWFLKIFHTVIDILAGIPSVVYGIWGIIVIIPFIEDYLAPFFNVQTSGYGILAGGWILSIMSIPYVLNLLIEVLGTVPVELKEVSLSLGSTYWEAIKHVILKKGFPGIIASFGLGISKALGETIAVLMVVGNVIKIPTNIFDQGYPLPALIANNYGEMMSIPMYDSALMLAALILFLIILFFNIISRIVIHKTESI